ncbi:hypothetical protein UFOVP1247_46 [uncultured Caudovirales phage]|uniref:Uncharacterized protein n=1 Tax=uncultured Caudovirales phage TaxID=2100421 RepID=A0A6J5R8H2_9CAUD|nr:hypothetical protein UFOVP970_86 [uncultured Caudovirales phage]CAB4193253.1 hypothetical protein UFOVP1247_46 [uncultured Caudovirales phage]
MANFQKVYLYEKSKIDGVTAIRPVGGSSNSNGGWDGQRNMRLNADNVTLITSLGRSINDVSVYNVKVNGAKDFITDTDGIAQFDNWKRINLFTRTLQPEGTDFEGRYKYQYFGYLAQSSARVVPQSVATVVSLQVTGVDVNGDDTGEECFRVTMIDGTRFVTDRNGYNDVVDYATAP